MVWGIITAVLFILTAAHYITKRCFPKIDSILGKIHKITGLLLIVVLIIHITSTIPLIKQRPIEIYISGFILVLCAVSTALSYAFRRKLGALWIKVHRSAAVIMLVCLIFHVYTGLSSLKEYKEDVADIEIENIDVSNIEDGAYVGDCNVGYIYAKVEVQVEDGRITEVDILEHRTERGQKAEAVAEDIVKEQRINVDVVSGATNSSKVIMKAVENALRGVK